MVIEGRVFEKFCVKEVEISLNYYPVCIISAIEENGKCKYVAIFFHDTW